jgi:hypothetical protein
MASGCAAASPGPRALRLQSAAAASQLFAWATTSARDRLRPFTDRAVSLAQPARDTARACLDDWRAAPPSRNAALFDLYRVSVTRPVFVGEEPVLRHWLDRLLAAPGVDNIGPLRDARRALRSELAFLHQIYAKPIDACAAIRTWHAAD